MATEYGGYMGKILLIDLTTETTEEYPFTDQQRRETLGGKALAYRILADQVTGKESAFSEENLLILSTGPFTGTGAPGSIRFDITALSPKTGLPSSSNCGIYEDTTKTNEVRAIKIAPQTLAVLRQWKETYEQLKEDTVTGGQIPRMYLCGMIDYFNDGSNFKFQVIK